MASTGKDKEGWIKIDRKILNNVLWQDKPFSKGQAWVDLLLSAKWQDEDVWISGSIVRLKKGQIWTSQMKLEKRWGWSKNKVRRFLALLAEQRMIHIDGTSHGTTLTVVNWDKFQNEGTTNGTTKRTTNGTPNGTTDGTHTRNNKKDKEEKEEVAPLPSSSEENDTEEYPWDDPSWFDEVDE